MRCPGPSLLALAAAIGLATSAQGLIVFGYNAAVNERFSSGFSSSPVANTDSSFLGAGLDFSGVGWLSANSQFSLALVSPQHFVITAHTAPTAGASVSFFNQAGVVKTYTVDSVTVITHTAGVNTDIAIGRLTAPIAGADQITSYPFFQLSTFNAYLGRSLLVYGQNGRIGTNTLDTIFLNADLLPFGGGNGVADSTLFSTDHDSATNETQGESGDSGSPTFITSGSTLALVGIHSAIDTAPTPDLTFDSFVPNYFSQINSLLSADGFSLQAIPEPSSWGALAGLAGLAMVLRRRAGRL